MTACHQCPLSFTLGPSLHSMVLQEFKESKTTLKYYMGIKGKLQDRVKERDGNDAMLALWMRLEIRWLVNKIQNGREIGKE